MLDSVRQNLDTKMKEAQSSLLTSNGPIEEPKKVARNLEHLYNRVTRSIKEGKLDKEKGARLYDLTKRGVITETEGNEILGVLVKKHNKGIQSETSSSPVAFGR